MGLLVHLCIHLNLVRRHIDRVQCRPDLQQTYHGRHVRRCAYDLQPKRETHDTKHENLRTANSAQWSTARTQLLQLYAKFDSATT